MENCMTVPEKIKQNYHTTQQFHFCMCTQKNWKQDLKEVFALMSIAVLFTIARSHVNVS